MKFTQSCNPAPPLTGYSFELDDARLHLPKTVLFQVDRQE